MDSLNADVTPTAAPAALHDAALNNAALLCVLLNERMAHRGWNFRESGTGALGSRPEWPTQLTVLVREAEADHPAILGLAIDLGSMPLRGERFRDIFNGDREELMGRYGRFTLRQLSDDEGWLKPISGAGFLNGMSSGISRKARLAVFDRLDDQPTSLVERFATDAGRLTETAAEIAALLQRLYQRTVLTSGADAVLLPEIVAPSRPLLAVAAGGSVPDYPWRR